MRRLDTEHREANSTEIGKLNEERRNPFDPLEPLILPMLQLTSEPSVPVSPEEVTSGGKESNPESVTTTTLEDAGFDILIDKPQL